MAPSSSPRSGFPRSPILCYVTDRHALEVPADGIREVVLLDRIREAAAAGVDWIQVREKDLDAGALVNLARAAVVNSAGVFQCSSQTASPAGTGGQMLAEKSGRNVRAEGFAARARMPTRILVNERLDVAWAASAGGVHLGETSLPVREVAESIARWNRAAGREDFLVGASCHSSEGAAAAARDGADYIFFGPVFATPSKARFGPPQGLAALAENCQKTAIPVIAVGGITAENAAACLEAGCAGVAAIRLFQQSPGFTERVVQAIWGQLRNSGKDFAR